MKPVGFLFSHLNLQVLWFRLNFCHYFIVISTGFSFCIILMKEKEGTNRTRFWFSWYNYCLPLVLFSILSVALGSAPNSADVYFEGCESRFSNNKSGYELNRSEGGNEIEWYFETCRYLVRNDREFLFTFGFSFQFMMYELKMSTHSKIESLPRRSLRINVCSIVTVFIDTCWVSEHSVVCMSVQCTQSIDNGIMARSVVVKISMKKTALRCVNNMEKSLKEIVHFLPFFIK